MTRLVVAGACGRMGRMILSLALKDKNIRVAGGLEVPGHDLLGEDIGVMLGQKKIGAVLESDPVKALKKADALIDFTHFSAMSKHLKAAVKTKTAYVLGTTGLKTSHMNELRKASRSIAVVQAPNMSVGVNLLLRLVELTSGILDESYDIEITEAHHRMKKDSPSGTALKLLEVAAKARKKNLKKDVVYGREGEVGARPRGEIGVFAIRGGDVVGDHLVSYLGDGERIELAHKASSREAFASGALKAAHFAARRKSGFFDMQQVLGLKA